MYSQTHKQYSQKGKSNSESFFLFFIQDDEINLGKRSPKTKEAPNRHPREYEPDDEYEMAEPMNMLKPGFFNSLDVKTFTDDSTKAPKTKDMEPLWDMPE